MRSILLLSILLLSLQVSAQEKTTGEKPKEVPMVESPQTEVIEHVRPGGNDVIDFPDVEAEFKGGQKALGQFVAKNFVYPQQAIEENIQGRVYASFVVEKNGKVTNVIIERGVHPALDQAVLDMIKKMPKWKPGKMGTKKVRTRCRLPINCTMN